MPAEPQPRRILLAASARSGSTWTARVLASGPLSRFVEEPDNVNTDAASGGGSPGAGGFGAFPVLRPGEQAPGYRSLWVMAFAGRVPGRKGLLHPLARVVLSLPAPARNAAMRTAASVMRSAPGRSPTVVIQTVMAHFALEWIAAELRPAIVVAQRDPRNVVSSWVEWNVHGFDTHERPAVRRACHELGIELPPVPATQIGRTAWWVGLQNAVLARLVDRHPDWVVVTHEELCDDPFNRFRELYARLGLEWTSQSETFLRETGYSPPAGRSDHGRGVTHGDAEAVRRQVSQKWRERLTDDQVREIETVLDTFPTRGWVREPVGLNR